MKGKELADYLLEHPDWDVQFLFVQEHDKFFDITDVGNRIEHKTMILLGEENEK